MLHVVLLLLYAAWFFSPGVVALHTLHEWNTCPESEAARRRQMLQLKHIRLTCWMVLIADTAIYGLLMVMPAIAQHPGVMPNAESLYRAWLQLSWIAQILTVMWWARLLLTGRYMAAYLVASIPAWIVTIASFWLFQWQAWPSG